jgi:hypothetical protein
VFTADKNLEMAYRRCLDFEGGDSDVLLAAFPHLALLCEPETSNAHFAGVVRSLLLLGLANPTPENRLRDQPMSSVELPLKAAEMRQMALLP